MGKKISNNDNSSRSTKRSDDEKKSIAESICIAYEAGNVTLESCCGEFGITARTLWNWIDNNSEISDRFKKAKEKHSKIGKEGIREKAVDGLQRLITGYYVDETDTEIITNKKDQVIMKKVKTRKKYIAPNPTAIIFALKNCDPIHWNENLSIDFGNEKQVFKIGDQEITFT